MKYLLVLIISLTFFVTVFPQNYKQVKIHIQSLEDVEELQNAGLEFDHPQITKDNAITSNDKFYL